MKILLDHNIDRRFTRHLESFEVATTQSMGWSNLLNGDLLSVAESRGFTVLITADAGIRNQQNLVGRKISILVLRAFNNRLVTHSQMIPQVLTALETIQPGAVIEVHHSDFREG